MGVRKESRIFLGNFWACNLGGRGGRWVGMRKEEIKEKKRERDNAQRRRRERRKRLKAMGMEACMEVEEVPWKERHRGEVSMETWEKIEELEELTGWERGQILRGLGYSKGHCMPKCPSKSVSRVRRLRDGVDFEGKPTGEAKEPWHGDKAHAPCEKCRCGAPAGYGTNHPGSGWCRRHGSDPGRRRKQRSFAKMHEMALQARNPGLYRNLDFFDEVEKEGKDAAGRVDVQNELSAIRALAKQVIGSQDELGKSSLTDGYDGKTGEARLMTDGPRLKLMKSLFEAASKVAYVGHRIEQQNSYSADSIRVWFAKLAEEVKRQAPEFQTLFVKLMRDVGEPKKN